MTDTLLETDIPESQEVNRWAENIQIDERFDTPDKIGIEYKRRYAELQDSTGIHFLPWDIWFPLGEWYRNQHMWLVAQRHKVEAIEEKKKIQAANIMEIICDTCNEPFVKRPTRGRPPKTCYTCKPR